MILAPASAPDETHLLREGDRRGGQGVGGGQTGWVGEGGETDEGRREEDQETRGRKSNHFQFNGAFFHSALPRFLSLLLQYRRRPFILLVRLDFHC